MGKISKQEFLKKRNQYQKTSDKLDDEIREQKKQAAFWNSEAERLSNVLSNPEKYLKELSDEFEEITALNKKEIRFLFFATALQCCRHLIQPQINLKFEKVPKDKRHDSATDGVLEFKKGSEYVKADKGGKDLSDIYPDRNTIFVLAVPYDAMKGTERILIPGVSEVGKNINGINHHAATMGHDPILGYLFGTMNILTRTITFKNPILQTCNVHLESGSCRNQYVGEDIGIVSMLNRTVESARRDINRIPAAVIRQIIHMQSDKYTKQGLPIPFLPPKQAQKLLAEGWNSYELERFSNFLAQNLSVVGAQTVFTMIINIVIEILYQLMVNGKKGDSIYEVKAKKIILYSNAIASNSNIIYSAISANPCNVDVGGLLVTIQRIVSDELFISKVKDEFVYGGYRKQLDIRNISQDD